MKTNQKEHRDNRALYAQILANCLVTARTAEAAEAEAKTRYADMIRQRERVQSPEATCVKWIAAIMAVITTWSYLRAVYDHVGLNVSLLLTATPELHRGIAEDSLFNFLFLNGLVLAGVWASLPVLRDRRF